MICISRRISRRSSPLIPRTSWPSKHDAAGRRLDQPDQHAPGRRLAAAATRRRGRASRRAASVKLTPSTAFTVPGAAREHEAPHEREVLGQVLALAPTARSHLVTTPAPRRGSRRGGCRRPRAPSPHSISGGSADVAGGPHMRAARFEAAAGRQGERTGHGARDRRSADPARRRATGMLASRPSV